MKYIPVLRATSWLVTPLWTTKIMKGSRRSGGGLPRKDTPVRGGEAIMHCILLPLRKGLVTDHINRNPLDNRRANLRRVTQQQKQFQSARIVSQSIWLQRCLNKRWPVACAVNEEQARDIFGHFRHTRRGGTRV